jgi:glycosyltransferase involved in cell wall biosynthesis
MNVTFFNSVTYGGAAQAAIRIFQATAPFGNVKNFITSSGETITYPHAIKHIKSNLKTTTYHLIEQSYLALIGKAPDRILTLNKWGINIIPYVTQADIIHLHWINRAFISLDTLAKIGQLNKPIVWTMHDMTAFTGLCSYADNCLNFQKSCGNCPYLKRASVNDLSNQNFEKKKRIYKNLDLHIVTCSQWLANTSKESTLLKDFPIIHIPNPIDTNQFRPLDHRFTLRDAYQIPKDKKVILFGAAKLDIPRKGFAHFVKALQILYQRKQTDMVILLVGDDKGVNLKEIPFPVFQLQNLNTEKMIEAYNLADIYVLPSLQDNFPNMILEAMSCGVPSVGFDTGGIPEMINHQINGYVAQVQNDEDLATGIQWCLKDLQNLSQLARKKVVTHYSYEIVGKQYDDLYQSLSKL